MLKWPAAAETKFCEASRLGIGYKARRPAPCLLHRFWGIRLPGKGAFALNGSRTGVETELKSPFLNAAVSTVARLASCWPRRCPSNAAKKNVLSFLMGPPSTPPNWFRRNDCFCGAKKFRVSNTELRWNSQTEP